MLVAVERHRLAVPAQVRGGRCEVVERGLGLDEAELHGAARRIIDVHEQRARRAAILEPRVLAAVDLDELADAVAAMARLVGPADPLAARRPEPGRDEPLPKRPAADPDIVHLEELLVGKLRAEVGVPLAHQRDGARLEVVGEPPVAGPAALLGNEPSRSVAHVGGARPLHLALRDADQLASLRARQPALEDSPDDVDALDLSRAHGDQLRPRHRAASVEATPSRVGATFLRGPIPTFARGHYIAGCAKSHYVNSRQRYRAADTPPRLPCSARL